MPRRWPTTVRAFYEFHACDARAVGRSGGDRSRPTARASAPRSTATACAPAATRSRATVWWCSRRRPACSTSIRRRRRRGRPPRARARCWSSTRAGRIVGDDEIEAGAGPPPALPALARRAEDVPRGPPAAAPAGRSARGAAAPPAAAFGYTEEELELLIAPMARDGAGADRLDGRRHAARGALGAAAAAAPLLQAALRPGHEPADRPAARGAGDEPAHGRRRDRQPARRDARARAAAWRWPQPDAHERASWRSCARLDREPLPRRRRSRRSIALAGGAEALERALDALCREASRASRWDGHTILDPLRPGRRVPDLAPMPPLLATAAVHSHLVREGARTRCGLVVESGEPREVMHFALLVGFGAAAVNPYLALETVEALRRRRDVPGSPRTRGTRYVQAVGKGLLKVCSKMGISTVQSYRGAQIFEAVGLGPARRALLHRHAPRASAASSSSDRRRGRACATSTPSPWRHALDPGGEYAYRRARRAPRLEPRRRSSTLQRAVRDELDATLRRVRARDGRRREPAARCAACSSCVRPPVPLPLERGRAVERDRAALRDRRDVARLDLAGGARDARDRDEPPRRPLQHRRGRRGRARSVLDATATCGARAIKQVASARFGVTAALPGRRRRAADQGRAGREARRGRPAARPQGRRRDRAPAPLDAGRRADLAAAPPRHLLDRGPRAADPRPAAASTRRPRSGSSSSPRPASARSPPASPRPGPSTS